MIRGPTVLSLANRVGNASPSHCLWDIKTSQAMTERYCLTGRLSCGALLVVAFVATRLANAQVPRPAVDRNVSPASLNRPVSTQPAARAARFGSRAPLVGDQVRQVSAREMRLTTTERQ